MSIFLISVVSAFLIASAVFGANGTFSAVLTKLVEVLTPLPRSANGSCVGALVTIVSIADGSGTQPLFCSNIVSGNLSFGIS